jgi:NAD(P)-dependent dehydrogenase (short-subunit alcohol dehydrogenase family)
MAIMNSMDGKILKDRVAIVTGGSRGLGKAIAVSLASAGATLGVVSRKLSALNTAAEDIRRAGGEVATFQADITSEEQVRRLEHEVLGRFGRLDILVNNAGINLRKPMQEFSLDEWNHLLATNLTSVFLMCRSFVPHMRGRGYGRILNLTSIMSHVSFPGRAAYCASKAGLLGFTKALALELAPDGITVVAISPGPFATEMNTAFIRDPEVSQTFVSRIPIGRWGTPSEVGQLACYLCSPDAGFITGTDILIDGGWTAQ